MGEIRTFTEEFLAGVADLHLRVMRGRKARAGKDLQDYFREIILDNPWASPEFPSFVYLEKGLVAGFLGVVPRTMEFNGRPIRVAVSSQFMVDRERHRGLAALELRRRGFQGPQDLSYVDGAAEGTHAVWTAAGGLAARLYAFHWLRVLKPFRAADAFVDRARGMRRWAGRAGLIVGPLGDFMLSKVAFRKPKSPYQATRLDADEMFECIARIGWREPLKPAYEAHSFRWLISQIERVRAGAILRMARVEADGEPCGWYIYVVMGDGSASLLQLGVRRRDHFDGVFQSMLSDAWEQGAGLVRGQTMPDFLVNLTHQGCLFRQPDTSALFHTKDKELADVILRGRAALTFLDGERWMRFTTEKWQELDQK